MHSLLRNSATTQSTHRPLLGLKRDKGNTEAVTCSEAVECGVQLRPGLWNARIYVYESVMQIGKTRDNCFCDIFDELKAPCVKIGNGQ